MTPLSCPADADKLSIRGFRLLAICIIACSLVVPGILMAEEISATQLKKHVSYLANDRLEGRGPGTQGLVAAGGYIAARFRTLGLEPAGDDDDYFQYFEVTVGVELKGTNSLQVNGKELALDSDWRPYGFSEASHAAAPLVFAGYGIRASEYDYDDYEGLDVKGKIVLVLALEPKSPASTDSSLSADATPARTSTFFHGNDITAHSNLHTKAIQARESGAIGMLVVIGPNSDVPDRLASLRAEAGYYSSGILCGQITYETLQSMLPHMDIESVQKQIDSSGLPHSQELRRVSLDWTIGLHKKRSRLRNVLGYLPGSDPHHALVIGAHYDHLGYGGSSSLDPDSEAVHNGADDNASGTAALVDIAAYFAGRNQKPAQSILFAAFSGEEIGLAGSAHYVSHPTIPMEFTSSMLNMDMIGRLREDKLMIFGVETAQEFRPLLEKLNTDRPQGKQFELTLKGDGYGPSDQMSFYKKDVPVLHFFTGAHSEYHKPSDDIETLNFAGMARVADFVVDTANAIMSTEIHKVTASEKPATSASSAGVGGFRSYLGTIPDYAQADDLVGVLLTGVRKGGPADTAGLMGGDLIVRIDSMDIRNIYDYMHILQTREPKEKILITVLRAGEKVQLPAILGTK